MAKDKFDTLSAARSLGTAGIEDEQAAAIVGAIRLAVSDLVTVERFEAGLAELRTHTDTLMAELRAHTDTRVAELRAHTNIRVAELRADNWRARLALCRRHRRRQRTDADRGRLRAGRGPWRAAAYALIEHAQELLRSVYGYKNFRGRQEEVLAAALAGQGRAGAHAYRRRQVAVLPIAGHDPARRRPWWSRR